MNKLKLYQLKNIKKCPFKGYISQFDFKTLNNKSAMIRKIYNDIIQDYDFVKLTETELKNIISEKLDDKYFLTKQEKEVEAVTILNYLVRYNTYEQKRNRKILNKRVSGTVEIGGSEVEVTADIVFENINSIEVVKYKTSATTLSYKARTEKNLPENDIELYLLRKLGEQLYSDTGKPIISSLYHLKGKNEDKDVYKKFLEDKSVLEQQVDELKAINCLDKKEQKAIDKQIKTIEDVLYFDNSMGNNIITYNYDKDLSDEIIKLTQIELSFYSEKCVSGDCEFCSYSTLCHHEIKSSQNELKEIKDIKKSSGEVKLTDAQKQVVEIEEGNYRINAVAGSGKSTTMVMRTIELFKKGYRPSDILMITFTKKGCEELKEKINYWLDYYKIKGVNPKELNIFTFNAFGESIISKEWSKLGYTQQPKLATMIDINDIIKELLEEYDKIQWLNYKNPLMNYPNAKGAFKQLLIYFNLIKSYNYNSQTLTKEILSMESSKSTTEELNSKGELIIELYNKFNDRLKLRNLLQYQDQILCLIELFEKHNELINTYGYKHIVVDEYQDTDFTQVDLLHLLRTYFQFKSLMVVGDDAQAIYSFRNTTPENIIKFHEEFEDVKDIFLLDNFRSTPQICSVANNLIKLNTQRIDKDIISRKIDGKVPELLKFNTIERECEAIADLIQEKIDIGVPKHEICYIARTKKELLEFQKCLNARGVPNVVEASELYLNNTYVQCIINLANFFDNNEYTYYLTEYMFIINNKLMTMNTEDIIEYIEAFKDRVVSEFYTLESEEEKIAYFKSLVNPINCADSVAKSFSDRIENETFYTFNEFLGYLHKLMLYKDDTGIEKDDKKLDAVILTTAHSSKGKEWSIVINSINSYKYGEIISNLQLLEEERRLLFTSITRAKDELYITYNTNENKARNKGKYTLFADELEDVKRIDIE